jgi:hypothetical protein
VSGRIDSSGYPPTPSQNQCTGSESFRKTCKRLADKDLRRVSAVGIKMPPIHLRAEIVPVGHLDGVKSEFSGDALFAYNFITRRGTLRMPPAVKAKTADHQWTHEELAELVEWD